MAKWVTWCLIIFGISRVNMAGIRNLRQTQLADEKLKIRHNLKKPFLNITNPEDADMALIMQFFSMMTNKDFFPWDNDENTNKKNREIVRAAMEMVHKLHAMNAANEIIDRAVTKTTEIFYKSIDTLPNAITMMCDYIEQGFRNNSILNLEYQRMKDNIKTKLENGTFTRSVYCEQFYDRIKISENFLALLNTREVRLLRIWAVFESESQNKNRPKNYNLMSLFIKISQTAANGTVRDELQNIYDKEVAKLADDIKLLSEKEVLFKGNTISTRKAQTMILSELLKGMKKAVNENSVLKNLNEVKTCPLLTSVSDKEMEDVD